MRKTSLRNCYHNEKKKKAIVLVVEVGFRHALVMSKYQRYQGISFFLSCDLFVVLVLFAWIFLNKFESWDSSIMNGPLQFHTLLFLENFKHCGKRGGFLGFVVILPSPVEQ